MTAVMQLRDYQLEAQEAVFREEKAGYRRQCIVLPTGAGKTATAVATARTWRDRVDLTLLGGTAPGRRILWITHRDELVDQTVAAFDLWWHDVMLDIGVVKADRNDMDMDIVIASVQTLAVESRLNALLERQLLVGAFGLVISDEHHHSPSPTWARVLDSLGCGQPDGPLMLGLTATPNRSDGVGLKATTDKIVFERDVVWAIGQGFLVPPKGRTIDVDLSSVKMSNGDYGAGSLGDVLELEGAHAAVGQIVTRYCSDRKTVIFTPTVRFAELVGSECGLAGHATAIVTGETPRDERRRIYADLRSGKIKVLVNCMVLTEGFDEPSVDCIIVARPTRSESLFIQMVGRGLRLYPGKTDCTVICLAGTERHKLATLATLAGRTWAQKMKAAEAAQQEEFDFAFEFDRIVKEEAKRANMKTREVNLLAGGRKRITWGIIDESTFAKRGVSGDRDDKSPQPVVVIKRTRGIDDLWKVVRMDPRVRKEQGREFTDYVPKALVDGVDFNAAQAMADDEIRRLAPSNMLRADAPWRARPASDPQKEQLRKNNVAFIDGNITSGMASDLLDTVFLRRIAARA